MVISLSGKIWFADFWRGIAAICVVVSHLTAPLWPIAGSSPLFFTLLGQFGVSLFFLISGFVIPISLKSYSVSNFLIGRLLRIYPTYAAGFSVTLILTLIYSPNMPTLVQMLSHYLLIQDLLRTVALDGIVWTLQIELKFYVLCALFIVWLRAYSSNLLLVILADIGIALFFPSPEIAAWAMWLLLMFIGVVYNFHHNKRISGRMAVMLGSALFMAFAECWLTKEGGPRRLLMIAYFISQIVFLVSYLLKDKFKPFAVTRWLSAISYPLYVVHGVLGSVVANLANQRGVDWLPAILLAFVVVIIAAWLIHVAVEKPSHQLGRRLKRAPRDNEGTRQVNDAAIVGL
ncbi:MAG: acyltransferase 3 [Rubritepida sp.]|nr:acyltransferase 3 [Rubritepida sp.]